MPGWPSTFQRGFGRRKPGAFARVDPTHDLAKGLTGCWLFNEGGGRTVHDIASANNGTITSTGTLLPAFTSGAFGSSAFTCSGGGSADYAALPSFQYIKSTVPFTIAILVRPKSLSSGGFIFANLTNDLADAVALAFLNFGGANQGLTLGGAAWGSFQDGRSLPANFTNGGPHLLTFVYNGLGNSTASNYTFYYDLSPITGSAAGSLGNQGATPYLFRDGANTLYSANGLFEEILIYNRALLPAEISWLYEEPFAFIKQPAPRRSFFGPSTTGWTCVQSTGTSPTLAGITAATAFASNVTAGNLIVVGVSGNAISAPIYTVADSLSNTYAPVDVPKINGLLSVQLFYAKNITGGACTVTVTANQSSTLSLGIAEYSGLDKNNPFDSTSSSSGTSTAGTSGTVTVSGAGELLVGVLGDTTATTSITNGVGFTDRYQDTTTGTQAIDLEDISASANLASTWTLGVSVGWAAQAASFKLPFTPAGGFNPSWFGGRSKRLPIPAFGGGFR